MVLNQQFESGNNIQFQNSVEYLVQSYVKKELELIFSSEDEEMLIINNLIAIKEKHNLDETVFEQVLELCMVFLNRCRKNEHSWNHLQKTYFIIQVMDDFLAFGSNNWVHSSYILNLMSLLLIRPYVNYLDEKMCMKLFGDIFIYFSNKNISHLEFVQFIQRIKDSMFLDSFLDIFYFFNSLQFNGNSIENNLKILDQKIQIEKDLINKPKIMI